MQLIRVPFLVIALSALQALIVFQSPVLHADDQMIDNSADVRPAIVSREAALAMVEEGAQVVQVSEQDAIARAASYGLTLKPNVPGSPGYGHPWVIIKAGLGATSGINLGAEIYVNDNWSLEADANVTLAYGALVVGTRWHPDLLCWNCKGKLSFTLSPGIEAGRVFSGLSMDPGTIVTASAEGELRYRPTQHFILSIGVEASGGTIIEDPYTIEMWNGPQAGTRTSGGNPVSAPNPTSNPNEFTPISHPAVANAFGDAMLYIGVGF